MWGRLSRNGRARLNAGLFCDGATIAVASNDTGRLWASAGVRSDADVPLIRPADGKTDLTACAVTSVLTTGSYQLLLVDLPHVPPDEIKAAVRWQIKDLLDFPAEDAVVELLDIPEQSHAGGKMKSYAVVARRSALQQHVDDLHQAGIEPVAIDIPELCMRNIAAHLPQDEAGVALLHFTGDRGMLTVTRQGILYFIRHVDLPTDAVDLDGGDGLAQANHLSSVILDVQRSLDYYESHYDRRPVKELVLTSAGAPGRLAEQLRQQLGLTVSELDVASHFELDCEILAEQRGAVLLAIGAALRGTPLAA